MCSLPHLEATHALSLLPPVTSLPNNPHRQNSAALDFLQRDMEFLFRGGVAQSEIRSIRIQLAKTQATTVAEFGSDRFLGEQRIDDGEEGAGHERSVLATLAGIFGQNTHASPFVLRDNKLEEFTDVLAFTETAVCLVECKAVSLLDTQSGQLNSSAWQRRLDRHLDKAMRKQLPRAISEMQAGKELFENNKMFEALERPYHSTIILECLFMRLCFYPRCFLLLIGRRSDEGSRRVAICVRA